MIILEKVREKDCKNGYSKEYSIDDEGYEFFEKELAEVLHYNLFLLFA